MSGSERRLGRSRNNGAEVSAEIRNGKNGGKLFGWRLPVGMTAGVTAVFLLIAADPRTISKNYQDVSRFVSQKYEYAVENATDHAHSVGRSVAKRRAMMDAELRAGKVEDPDVLPLKVMNAVGVDISENMRILARRKGVTGQMEDTAGMLNMIFPDDKKFPSFKERDAALALLTEAASNETEVARQTGQTYGDESARATIAFNLKNTALREKFLQTVSPEARIIAVLPTLGEYQKYAPSLEAIPYFLEQASLEDTPENRGVAHKAFEQVYGREV